MKKGAPNVYWVEFKGPMVSFGVTFKQPCLRFGEWSQAGFNIQKMSLLREDGGNKWDLRFMSIYHDTDQFMEPSRDLITGRCMDQWWDSCDEAGPAARTSEPFSIERPTLECLAASDGEVKTLRLHCDQRVFR